MTLYSDIAFSKLQALKVAILATHFSLASFVMLSGIGVFLTWRYLVIASLSAVHFVAQHFQGVSLLKVRSPIVIS